MSAIANTDRRYSMTTVSRKIQVKRIYEEPKKDDGFRVLVDRLWPRGISKDRAQIELWSKDISPSSELRKKYHGDDDNWPEFKKAYYRELKDKQDQINELFDKAGKRTVTLLYAAKNEERNNAVALMEYLQSKA